MTLLFNGKANCYGISENAYHMAYGDTQDDQEPYDTEDAQKFADVYCAECPVKKMCLEYGMKNGNGFGVWGGKTPEERNKISRVLR